MFDNIIGHKDKKTYFENIIEKHEMSHSYIFYGDSGIGKGMLAKEISKILLNTDNLDSCPDYKYIGKQQDKKNILIEQIRKDIIDDVYIRPICSDYKIYIIDDAELMNVASQNSLLKTLEEPPKYVVLFIITSNINNILTTILSRACKIYFSGVDNASIQKYSNDKFNFVLSNNILNYINGSIGKLQNIIEKELLEEFKLVDEFSNILLQKDSVGAMINSTKVNFLHDDTLQYLESIMYCLNKYKSVKHIEKANFRLKNNGNYDIVIDNMILNIIDEI